MVRSGRIRAPYGTERDGPLCSLDQLTDLRNGQCRFICKLLSCWLSAMSFLQSSFCALQGDVRLN